MKLVGLMVAMVVGATTVHAGLQVQSVVVETQSGMGFGWTVSVHSALLVEQFHNAFETELVNGETLLLRFVSTAEGRVHETLSQGVLEREAHPLTSGNTFSASELGLSAGYTALLDQPISFDWFVANEAFVDLGNIYSQTAWHLFPLEHADFLLDDSSVTFNDWWEGSDHRFSATATMTVEATTGFTVVPEPTAALAFSGLILIAASGRWRP